MIYEGEERRERSGWHVDKTISISHLTATVTMLVAGVWYLAGQDQRINANEININHTAKTSLDRDLMIERAQKEAEIRGQRTAERIESKLDKLLEHMRERK